MAKRRPAVHCTARRSNGAVCRNFAMYGTWVCHAHGGRAPQVRRAAQYRMDMAGAMGMLARHNAQRRLREEAVAPWAPAIRSELFRRLWDPQDAAHRFRAMAREMSGVARELRAEARQLLDEDRGEPPPDVPHNAVPPTVSLVAVGNRALRK
jgi:hypothetical protein